MRMTRAILVAVLALSLSGAAPALALSRIESVDFADTTHGYMAGFYIGSGGSNVGFLSASSDGGASWSAQTQTPAWFSGVSAFGSTGAWAVTGDDLWRTTNGGSVWSLLGPVSTLSAQAVVQDVEAVSSTTGVAVGQQPGYYDGVERGDVAAIWKTSNGTDWTLVNVGPLYPPNGDLGTPSAEAALEAVDGSGSTLIAVGKEWATEDLGTQNRVLVYRSGNGGTTWTMDSPPVGATWLADVAMPSASVGWTGGKNLVYRSVSGGAWTKTAVNPPGFGTVDANQILGIDARDDQQVIAVGASGRIAYTSNGGGTWTSKILSSVTNLHSVSFTDATHAVAVGDDQVVARITIGAAGAISVTEATAVNGAIGAVKDTTPPATTISGIPAGWSKANVSFTLAASDSGSGVDKSYYRFGAGPDQTYSGPVSIATEGTTNVSYYSVDNESNQEVAKMATVKIDKTVPSTSSDAQTSYDGIAAIKLTATDGALSGVKTTKWKLDTAATWQTGTTAGTTVEGAHTLYFYSEDNAGNVEPVRQAAFSITGGTVATRMSFYAPTTSNYGGPASLYGYLVTDSGKVVGRSVRIEQSIGPDEWQEVATVTTSSSGKYAYSAKPTSNTTYRAVFDGDATYGPISSAPDSVLPKLNFSSAPAFKYYTQSYGKTYTVYGYIKPRHTAGTHGVVVKAYRKEKQSNGTYKYVYRKSFSTTAYDYGSISTKYSGSVKLPYKGRWRLRAYHASCTKNASTYSSYRYVTVK